jgi:hypothetical protein
VYQRLEAMFQSKQAKGVTDWCFIFEGDGNKDKPVAMKMVMAMAMMSFS